MLSSVWIFSLVFMLDKKREGKGKYDFRRGKVYVNEISIRKNFCSVDLLCLSWTCLEEDLFLFGNKQGIHERMNSNSPLALKNPIFDGQKYKLPQEYLNYNSSGI